MFTIENLRVEYSDYPLGIATQKPRFSYEIRSYERCVKQASYRLIVSENIANITNGIGDMFDSGVIASDDTFGIYYLGKELKSHTMYYWCVAVTLDNGEIEISEFGFFETALLNDNDWNGADWIGRIEKAKEGEVPAAPIFRREFKAKNVKRARAYIAGLGFYELYINGVKAEDRLIEAGQTDYEVSVLYSVLDVTNLIDDNNAIGVILGKGRYAMTTQNCWGWQSPPWRAECKFILKLMIEDMDGNITWINSDKNFKCSEGALKFDCLYVGEVYDARCEQIGYDTVGFDDSRWENAIKVEAPKGKLSTLVYEPVRVVNAIPAREMWKTEKGTYVFDFGVITSGIYQLEVNGTAGQKISIRCSEAIDDKGNIVCEYGGVTGVLQNDIYICKGEGTETYTPRFTYKGYQYIEVDGIDYADENTVIALSAHSDVDVTGDFRCSNNLLNTIHNCCTNAMINNYHSIITDTPVYEKNGWTGDAQLTSQAAMNNFDMIKFYTKWIRDVAQSQIDSGEICVICPTSDWGYEYEHKGSGFWSTIGGPVPAWDAALLLMPQWLYAHYGDKEIIREQYTTFTKYMDYIAKFVKEDGTLDLGLGDWLAPAYDQTACGFPSDGPAIVETTYYFLFAKAMQVYADIAGVKDDIAKYEALADKIKAAFNTVFYNAHGKYFMIAKYPRFRQTNNTFPLYAGIVNEDRFSDVLARLAFEVKNTNNGHLDCGIVGTKYIFRTLAEYGYNELAYEIATKTTYPSFGFMIENGATALWENYELSTRSLDHHMFASIEDYFYNYICGIKDDSAGFKTSVIKPMIPENLTNANGSIHTMNGVLSSKWVKKSGKLTLIVNIPENTTAKVYVPLTVNNDCASVTECAGACFVGAENGFASFSCGSGKYTFTASALSGANTVIAE